MASRYAISNSMRPVLGTETRHILNVKRKMFVFMPGDGNCLLLSDQAGSVKVAYLFDLKNFLRK
jgi:hypothetical protein